MADRVTDLTALISSIPPQYVVMSLGILFTTEIRSVRRRCVLRTILEKRIPFSRRFMALAILDQSSTRWALGFQFCMGLISRLFYFWIVEALLNADLPIL
jgi:hypothetical protein